MMDEVWVEYDGGLFQEWHRDATRIRVASGVTVIPEEAFADCAGLIAVDLGHVTTISDYAFLRCLSLERVVWTTASSVEIGEGAFSRCTSLEDINLSNVTKMGELAFNECQALKSVTIPSSVAAIEAHAFSDCTNLAEVELGEGIQRIGERAFCECSGLVQINIPSSVTNIAAWAFWDCNSLEEVELHEGLQCVGARAFGKCTSLQSINVPSTTLEVGNLAFAGCHQLRIAELQEGLMTIGRKAFSECRSLERITIPSSVTLIGVSAFWNCHSLAEVTLREGLHYITHEAFGNEEFGCCPNLGDITIPPLAFVIDVEGSSCQLLRTATMPKIFSVGKLVVSKWIQHRSPDQLAQAESKVNEILGHIDLTDEEKIQCIRKLFAYYDLVDVTTILELAIWRAKMDGNQQDAGARQASRTNCGNDMNIIIPGVLPFLEV